MSTTQEALFTVGPTSNLTHVLMPCMAYACGGDIVTKGGHFVFDPVGERGKVDCPECRALDPDALVVEMRRQQGRQA